MTDEHERKMACQTVAAVFLPIAAITVALRIYVRGWIVKAFGWDDGVMVVAMVCSILNPLQASIFSETVLWGCIRIRDLTSSTTAILRHVLRDYDWRHNLWHRLHA